MTRNKRHHFRQRDVTCLLKAFEAAKAPSPIIEISPDGKLTAIPDAQHAEGRTAADDTPEAIINRL
jgi:hypothetical protein